MADKNDTKPATSTTDAAPAAAPSQILKQGKAPEPIAPPTMIAAAGTYKVIHGAISFGNGETALMGAHVALSAAEASLMIPHGVIEAV